MRSRVGERTMKWVEILAICGIPEDACVLWEPN